MKVPEMKMHFGEFCQLILKINLNSTVLEGVEHFKDTC